MKPTKQPQKNTKLPKRGEYSSGQRGLPVEQMSLGLRRFKSFLAHHINKETVTVIGIPLLLLLILGLASVDYHAMQVNNLTSVKQVEAINKRINQDQQYLANTTCYTWTGYTMYNGIYPEWGDVAIRFNSPLIAEMELEIGDRIWIEEFEQEFRVSDRIPDYQSADVDVYMETSKAECRQWGRHQLKIEKL